jgi:nitrate reductase NapD
MRDYNQLTFNDLKMNISSVVVHTLPVNMNSVIDEIKKSDFCEYELDNQEGKIVVIIEGESTEEEIEKLKLIKRLPNVISAEMVFSYNEEELDKLRENIDIQGEYPQWLNNENIKAEDIKYKGDLKKFK